MRARLCGARYASNGDLCGDPAVRAFYSRSHVEVLFRCGIHGPVNFSKKLPTWVEMTIPEGELKKLELLAGEVMET